MKWLMTYAVEEEYTEIKFPHDEVIPVCTGIGKVNAAFRLTEAICENQPDAVLNIGTVGTIVHQVGDVFVCRQFIDRDMQKLASLGLPYQIVFREFPVLQDFSWEGKKEGICNTGDSFLTELTEIEGDIVDMEAYAQAVVCKGRNLPFVLVKYVTDIIGKNSVKHWQDKLAEARKGLNEFFK